MKIAVEGCSHGELDKIYATIQLMEKEHNFKVDLLLCCGDFQSVRNKHDLECMAVPAKYRHMQDFHRYYSGEKEAPILTIFIGGNHEASGYLAELPYGGWVCRNIYYMGYANIIRVGNVRLGGLSGIYKGPDYLKGHFECVPYSENTKRSAYHIRNVDVFRLKQLSGDLDIFMSHDWPRGVYHHGNVDKLLRQKPFFQEEIATNTLGSRPAGELLAKLKPSYWFSGHLHVKFAALVKHEETEKTTRFLALDKCLPRRQFLQILDVPNDGENLQLHYDPEWLSILNSTNHLLSIKNGTQYMPGPSCDERWNFTPTPEELENVKNLFDGNFQIPADFEKTAEPFPSGSASDRCGHVNPQTTRFCQRLGISDPNALLLAANKANFNNGKQHDRPSLSSPPSSSPSLAECNLTTEEDANTTFVSLPSLSTSINPDEISLDEDGDDHEGGNEVADADGEHDSNPDDNKEAEQLPSGASFVLDRKPEVVEFPEFRHRDPGAEGYGAVPAKRTSEAGEGKKLFKRRNQAMYERKDEDDEDSSS